MNTRHILGLGSLALSLLATGAQAQNPALTLAFDTDGSTQASAVSTTGTVSTRGLGIGYDPNNTFGVFPNSLTAASSQSVFNPLITDSSAAGAFQTIAAGSQFQLGLHAFGNNNANIAQPVTVFASLFAFNPNAGAGNVPLGQAIFSNLAVSVTNDPSQNDGIFFSNTITLANSINAGQEYVLAVDGGPAGGANPTSFATADRQNFAVSGLPTADASIYRQEFFVDNNSGDSGGAFTSRNATALTQPLGYRFYSTPAGSPVPEASSVVSFGVLLALGGLFLLRRRTAR